MPYCEAVIMELLRLADITPEGLPHYSKSPVKLGQYIIPAGHMLMPSLTNVLKGDKQSWSRPEDFNPNRSVAQKYLRFCSWHMSKGSLILMEGFMTEDDGINYEENHRMT